MISGKKISLESMKKYLYMIMAAAALMAVGCEKNIETAPEGDDAQGVYSLTIDLPTDTKITFDGADGYKSSWDEGDNIFVQTSADGKYDVYTFDGYVGENKKQATFTGSVAPLNGGKVLYPAKKIVAPAFGDSDPSYAGWELSGEQPEFHFPDTYVWDVQSSLNKKFNSIVPMVGTVKGTTAAFDYASGAILIEYSKMTLTTAKFTIELGGVNPTGSASLNSDGTEVVGTSGSGTITIYMNEQHTMIGGTPVNNKFLIPLPAGTYTSLNMKMYRQDGLVIGGSDFSMASGKQFSIVNKQLRVLPKIVPDFPMYTMVLYDSNERPNDGTYILAYDKGDGTALVNGDDNLRETLPAQIVTLNHVLYGWANDKQGIILDQADYETAAWKVTVPEDYWGDPTRSWTIETGKKGQLLARFLDFSGDYVQLYVYNPNSSSHSYNNIRYYTASELDNGGFSDLDPPVSDPIWDNGGFIYGPGLRVTSNIKLFKLVTESSVNTSN